MFNVTSDFVWKYLFRFFTFWPHNIQHCYLQILSTMQREDLLVEGYPPAYQQVWGEGGTPVINLERSEGGTRTVAGRGFNMVGGGLGMEPN